MRSSFGTFLNSVHKTFKDNNMEPQLRGLKIPIFFKGPMSANSRPLFISISAHFERSLLQIPLHLFFKKILFSHYYIPPRAPTWLNVIFY